MNEDETTVTPTGRPEDRQEAAWLASAETFDAEPDFTLVGAGADEYERTPPQIGPPEELIAAAKEAGEYDVVDTYEERPFSVAVTEQGKQELVAAGLAEGEGDEFRITAPRSMVPR